MFYWRASPTNDVAGGDLQQFIPRCDVLLPIPPPLLHPFSEKLGGGRGRGNDARGEGDVHSFVRSFAFIHQKQESSAVVARIGRVIDPKFGGGNDDDDELNQRTHRQYLGQSHRQMAMTHRQGHHGTATAHSAMVKCSSSHCSRGGSRSDQCQQRLVNK
ncbi:hypothetical protein niasHT_032360 [Heterodera trifolii]|uniref:Uncharacterized protein n=1 Tax=Heterodera trifolii TaxID=157864 RepID=A0ABD2HZZ2_9BILA